MKTYGRIDGLRLLNIRVVLDDTNILYEGMVEGAPKEILDLHYQKVEGSSPMILYIYSNTNQEVGENHEV